MAGPVPSKAMTSAGTTISISAALPATYDAVGYGALTWKEIGEVSDLGEFGREYNVVKFNPLKTRGTVKRKGSYDEGQIQMQLAKVSSDEGQQIAETALNSDASQAIKVILQNGDIFYFTAQVVSFTTNVGSVDQITSGTVKLEIDTDIVPVAA